MPKKLSKIKTSEVDQTETKMKKSLGILGTGLGIGMGVLIYDYLTQGEFDWIRAVSIAAIASVLIFIFEKFKGKKTD